MLKIINILRSVITDRAKSCPQTDRKITSYPYISPIQECDEIQLRYNIFIILFIINQIVEQLTDKNIIYTDRNDR